MAVLKCKMCGGNIEISGDVRVIECEYCGTNQTIPDGSDEKKVNLFNRANRLRMDCEFDKAAGVYESIVSEYPEESEGYWGLVLCRFGIEYVDDAATGKKIPTCHRTNTTSIMDDADFEQVLENSDVIAKGTYREEAKAIDRLQRKIISVAESEEPYDVFICYKETDDITKQRTEDSSIAQDIYTELVREGYKVFFSRITLRDKAGTEYEPYIYAALSSAKVMLAIGTKYDYYDAVWVKNEWGRFISMMKNDNTKHLIPCFKNLDAYDIPKEFKNLQALDMGEMMFFKNLIENVERFVGNTKIETVVETVVSPNAGALTKRGYLFLEDKDFKSAAEYFERALDENPEDAKAYFGKVLVELRLSSVEEMNRVIVNLDAFKDFDKALRFAVGQDKVYFEKIKENADKRRQIPLIISCLKGYIRKDEKYNEAKQKMETAETSHDYIKARAIFLLIGDYKDSADAAEQCREKCEELKKAEAERIAEEARKAEEERCREEKRIAEEKRRVEEARKAEEERRREEERIAEEKRRVEEARKAEEHAKELKKVIKNNYLKTMRRTAVASTFYTIGIHTDGTPIACGWDRYDVCKVSEWRDIVAIATGDTHAVGLRFDGTVVACGDNGYGQCNVSEWHDIIAIAAGRYHTVGLRFDGTVVACGDNGCGQCNVSKWQNITAIIVNGNNTIGLRFDGTVIGCGSQATDRCNAAKWDDIVAVAVWESHIAGLRFDGTVVACGNNECRQCNVSVWNGVTKVSVGKRHTIGLRFDGTVVACGDGEKMQCDVFSWSNIVEISAGERHTVGLCSDGTVKACGDNEKGQCDVSDWRNIVAVSAGVNHTMGLRSDGTVVACGSNYDGRCSVSGWTNIALPPKQETVEELLAFEKEQNTKRILAEKEALTKEFPTLGFFAMGRKKEINNRLAEIEQVLQNLK